MFRIPNQSRFQDTDSANKIIAKAKKNNILDTSIGNLHLEEKSKTFNLKKTPNNKKVMISDDKNILDTQSKNSPLLKSIQLRQRDLQQTNKGYEFSEGKEFGKMIRKHRINKIIRKFISKLKKNSIYREPKTYEPFQKLQRLTNSQGGYYCPKYVESLVLAMSILCTIFFCLKATAVLAFSELLYSQTFDFIHYYGIIWMIIEIFMNIQMAIKNVEGRNILYIFLYEKCSLLVNLLCFLELIICLLVQDELMVFLNFIFFLKLPDFYQKVAKIEIKVSDTFYKEQYWSLIKLILTNFIFAYFIAFALILMTKMDQQTNWLVHNNLHHAQWYEQYIWAYYWAINIMLTVGFGDLTAQTHIEVLCLIFIEMFSCMTLAYNINCVGNLISELRQRKIEKENDIKVLMNITKRNNINPDLNSKLRNHIEDSFDAQIKIDFKKEKQLLMKLPENLKQEYLGEANYGILSSLPLFKNFTNKTIRRIASAIETSLSHPGQILVEFGSPSHMCILKNGVVGSFPIFKASNKSLHKIPIDKMQIKAKDQPRFISLEFLSPQTIHNYEIKSIGFSIIYRICIEEVKELLKHKKVDYEYFFVARDKEKESFDELETIACDICNKEANHLKFRCPKLHYMPFHQTVILKSQGSQKKSRNTRVFYLRSKPKPNAISIYWGSKVNDFPVEDCQSMVLDKTGQTKLLKSKSLTKFLEVKQKQELRRSKILISAAEQVKKEVQKILYHEINSNFWDVQCDSAQDYTYYFPQCNPAKLLMKHEKKIKKSKSKKKQINNPQDKIRQQSYKSKV